MLWIIPIKVFSIKQVKEYLENIQIWDINEEKLLTFNCMSVSISKDSCYTLK